MLIAQQLMVPEGKLTGKHESLSRHARFNDAELNHVELQ
jgi:hypothetical protein